MDDEILLQIPGLIIARCYTMETLVPYPPMARQNGDVNNGWWDLRGRPDLVDQIPEAQKSEGMQAFLKAVCAPDSQLMSIGCECGQFPHEPAEAIPAPWHAGGFVDIAFQDADKNTDQTALFDLAKYLVGKYEPKPPHFITFELIIEPLKRFFERLDCLCLEVKVLGWGGTPTEAWAAFDYGWHEVARCLLESRR